MAICSGCNKNVEFLQAHHVVPKVSGGIDHSSNIINLCIDCHRKVHSCKVTSSPTLINKGVKKVKDKGKIASQWIYENEGILLEKIDKLAETNYPKYNLILSLFENGKIPADILMTWCLDGKASFKTMITL